MIEFNPFLLLFWVFLSSFVPGTILSFSILRKNDLPALDKLFIGFGVGIILLPLLPFFLYLFLGIKFSHSIAILSVIIMYLLAALAAFLSKLHEDILSFRLPQNFSIQLPSIQEIEKKHLLSLSLLLIILVTFWIRLGTYSPIFHELDPYYYTYISQQIIVFGENPFDDRTAWYPDLKVNHRAVPALSYLESLWYSLYSSGGAYDNMLLALIASCYPPIAAALAVYFLYLIISVGYKQEWAIIGAGIASFVPMFLYKTVAGEMEVQPYAFFALSMFLALYAIAIKKYDIRYALLASIAYAGLTLGSSSEVVAISVLLIFTPLYAVYLYFKEARLEVMRDFIVLNALILLIGAFFASSVVKFLFGGGSIGFSGTTIALFGVVAFSAALFLIKTHVEQKKANTLLAVLFVAGIIMFLFTPVGSAIKGIAAGGLGVIGFDTALKRTIAEQNPASGMLADQIGFVAESYPHAFDTLFTPLGKAIPVLSTHLTFLSKTLSGIADTIFGLVSLLVNFGLGVSISLLNTVIGTNVIWEDKSNNMLLLWIFLFVVVLFLSYKRLSREQGVPLYLLYAAAVFPPLLVGMLKAKYTLYAGFLLAIAIAMVFAEFDVILTPILRKKAEKFKGQEGLFQSTAFNLLNHFLLVAAVFLLFMQFFHDGYAYALLSESFKVRFQDNPLALQTRFKDFCSTLKMRGSYDADICAAAQDPILYANMGTNYQYNQKLCFYSIVDDLYNPSQTQQQAAGLRCQRLATYWVESMEWIRYNTENNSRTTSWWDYGHWINYFGQKNTVLRNEHSSLEMIGQVADAYLDGSASDLKTFMQGHDSKYALFDTELIAGGGTLGGKYGALNYLSCAYNNQTDVSSQPGQSECEYEHLWEQVFIPITQNSTLTGDTCTISKNNVGYKAYHVYILIKDGNSTKFVRSPYYPGSCIGQINDAKTLAACQQAVKIIPVYCAGSVLMADGTKTLGFYYLNESYSNCDLKLNKGSMELTYAVGSTYHFYPNVITGTMFYTKKKIWLENGQAVEGYSDRKGKFYDSNLYKAIFLDEIEGFDRAYSTNGGYVKIYKIKE